MWRIVVLFFILVAAAGTWATLAEGRIYLQSYSGSDGDRLGRLARGDLSPGYSLSSATIVLDECSWALRSPYSRLQSSELRLAAAASCDRLVGDVVREHPSLSYAWLVWALIATQSSDFSALSERLVQSHNTGPTSQWLARQRVSLSEDNLANLSSAAYTANRADLALLISSEAGIASIARRYVDQPDFRQRISVIVGKLDPLDQQRFIRNLDKSLGNADSQ